MKVNLRWAAALLAIFGAAPALACYTVYDRGNNIVYNAKTPPVDMSLPLHEALQSKYPGGHLVFGTDGNCPNVNTAGRTRISSPNGKAPLLTDASTAEAMGLPHKMIRNVAVVAETPDSMHPGVMVVESGIQPANDTRMMGAGAAPQVRAKPTTVITEMHNPPLTAVQGGR